MVALQAQLLALIDDLGTQGLTSAELLLVPHESEPGEHPLYVCTNAGILFNNTSMAYTSTSKSGHRVPTSDFEKDLHRYTRDLNALDDVTSYLRALQDEYESSTQRSKEVDMQRRICSSTNKGDQLIGKISKNLQGLLGATTKIRATSDQDHCKYLLTNFKNQVDRSLTAYHRSSKSLKELVVSKATRQLEMALPDASPDEIEELIASNAMQSILEEKIGGFSRIHLKDEVDHLETKVRAIRNLEKSAVQIGEMMEQLTIIVDQQTEMLDSAEVFAEEAKKCVTGTEQQIYAARERRRRQRFRIIWCTTFTLVLIISVSCFVVGQMGVLD